MSESEQVPASGPNRRNFMAGIGLTGLGVAGLNGGLPATSPALAQQSGPGGPIDVRALPKGGELPLIELGTLLTFDLIPGAPREHLVEVVKTYWEGGARSIDTSPLYGSAEYTVGVATADLGIANDVFFSDKIWSTGEFVGDDSCARAVDLTQASRRLNQPLDIALQPIERSRICGKASAGQRTATPGYGAESI